MKNLMHGNKCQGKLLLALTPIITSGAMLINISYPEVQESLSKYNDAKNAATKMSECLSYRYYKDPALMDRCLAEVTIMLPDSK